MPQVIENGYLYIGQPPLYRVKKGKNIKYLKDDSQLEAHLIELGVEDVKLDPKGNDKSYTGKQLEKIIRQLIKYGAILNKIGRRCDPRIIDSVVKAGAFCEKSLKADAKKIDSEMDMVAEFIGRRYPEMSDFTVDVVEDLERSAKKIVYKSIYNGFEKNTEIDTEMMNSPEIKELVKLRAEFNELGKSPYRVIDEGNETVFENLRAVKTYILERGRKGQDIQRYKGLGEMNPSQLWETTLDPERRTLLQVKVDDAVEADDIFTILMGDQVEPRREFIEKNALNVKNLDI
jgi:DNA gyrase subunit B